MAAKGIKTVYEPKKFRMFADKDRNRKREKELSEAISRLKNDLQVTQNAKNAIQDVEGFYYPDEDDDSEYAEWARKNWSKQDRVDSVSDLIDLKRTHRRFSDGDADEEYLKKIQDAIDAMQDVEMLNYPDEDDDSEYAEWVRKNQGPQDRVDSLQDIFRIEDSIHSELKELREERASLQSRIDRGDDAGLTAPSEFDDEVPPF